MNQEHQQKGEIFRTNIDSIVNRLNWSVCDSFKLALSLVGKINRPIAVTGQLVYQHQPPGERIGTPFINPLINHHYWS